MLIQQYYAIYITYKEMYYNYKPAPLAYIHYLYYGGTYHYVLLCTKTNNYEHYCGWLKEKSYNKREWKEKDEGEWNV